MGVSAQEVDEIFEDMRQLIAREDLGLSVDMVPVVMDDKTSRGIVRSFQGSVPVPTITIYDPPVSRFLEEFQAISAVVGFTPNHERQIKRDLSELLGKQARNTHAVLFAPQRGDKVLVSQESAAFAFLEAAFFNGNIEEINNDLKIHLRDRLVEAYDNPDNNVSVALPSAEIIPLFG